MKIKLRKGDKIAVAATARSLQESDLNLAKDLVKGWGLELVYDAELFQEENQFAGADSHRASIVNQYLADPSIKAIWIARGGYGTARMIDQIDLSLLKKSAKLIMGFSDVTVLHMHLNKHTELESLHCTMPLSLRDNSEECLRALEDCLKGEYMRFQLPSHNLNRVGDARARLIGGNLSVLYSILDSPSEQDFEGKILFLEDLDEYLYHIDRMMVNFKRTGRLAKLAGLVIGGMTDMNDNTVPFGKTAEEIIAEHVSDYDYPVMFGLPAGHLDHNMPLRLGVEYKLDVNMEFASLEEC